VSIGRKAHLRTFLNALLIQQRKVFEAAVEISKARVDELAGLAFIDHRGNVIDLSGNDLQKKWYTASAQLVIPLGNASPALSMK